MPASRPRHDRSRRARRRPQLADGPAEDAALDSRPDLDSPRRDRAVAGRGPARDRGGSPGRFRRGADIAAEARRAVAEVVVPAAPPAEMRDSIELGLEVLRRRTPPRAILLTPGDNPGITADVVAQLLECGLKWPDRVVVPTFQGRRGHPILLPWSLVAAVPALPQGVGVNALVSRHPVALSSCRSRTRRSPPTSTPERTCNGGMRIGPTTLSVTRTQSPERRTVQVARSRRLWCGSVSLPWPGSGPDARDRTRSAEFEHGRGPAGHSGRRLPDLAALLPNVLIAVNEEYADDDSIVPAGARIAVIPPVSGGARDPDDPLFAAARPEQREPARR